MTDHIPVVMFEGSEGKQEYYKVGEADGVRLGVRILCERAHQAGAHRFVVSFRCRMASHDGSLNIADIVMPNMVFAPFTKVCSTHGSIVRHLGSFLIRSTDEYEQAIAWLRESTFIRSEVMSVFNMRFNEDVIKVHFTPVPNIDDVITAVVDNIIAQLSDVKDILDMVGENVVAFDAKK